MNNLYLSYEAQNDLAEIKDYITKELENPNTALAIVKKITKNMRILEDFAYAGASLSSIADIDSDYRFLVSGNYIVFYRVCGNNPGGLFHPSSLAPRLTGSTASRAV